MKRSFLVLALAVSSVALSACWGGSGNNGGRAVVNTSGFNFKPVKGMTVDTAANVYSTGENSGVFNNIGDSVLEVTFTADEEMVIAYQGGPEIVRMNKTDVHHSFENKGPFDALMHTYSSFLSDGHRVADPLNDKTDVLILTGKAENEPEYAMMRVVDKDLNTNWVLMGTPTSAALTGTATYDGGYYMAQHNGSSSIMGKMDIAADFGTDNLDFALHAPTGDPGAFGASTIEFQAKVNLDNTIQTYNGASAGAAAILTAGSLFDSATVQGLFGDNGNAAAGLVTLQDSTSATKSYYGAFHAIKQ